MTNAVECTHCHVLMTGWSPPNSPVRYWQCPFCARTHSSAYSEVFERGGGARLVEPPVPATTRPGLPRASAEEIRWRRLRERAARWFERLEQEQVILPGRGAHSTAKVQPADRTLAGLAGAAIVSQIAPHRR